MNPSKVQEAQWSQLSESIAERMGLHFPRERWGDLRRGLAGAALEFGFEDAAACVGWLLSESPTKTQLQVLASHLTIGESYFFRDQQLLATLAENVLPELIRARRGRDQRLRIWSAACCTGEEPYSLAILLHQSLPDLQDWHVTINATDINANFLHKAAAGVYREWSFRNAPAGLKERYFNRTADGCFAIIPEIRKMVTFAQQNLVDDPSLTTGNDAMDVIFCRNVLMYFAPPQISKVISTLHHSMVDGGWLAVSPSEASHALFSQFVTVSFPGGILYQKSDAPARSVQRWTPAPLSEMAEFVAPAIETHSPWTAPAAESFPTESVSPAPAEELAPVEKPLAPSAVAELFYQQGRYADATDTLLDSFARHTPSPREFSLLTRALANQGKLADALAWCDRWIAADKLDAAGHYLRAVILLERGDREPTRVSLQRALYLRPDFVLAHFALGNLARRRGKTSEAEKHFANTRHSLRLCQPDDLLPESDGLTAGRLSETLNSITGARMLHG